MYLGKKITVSKVLLALVIILFCVVSIALFFPQNITRYVQVFATVVLFAEMLFFFNKSKNMHNIGKGLLLYYILILSYWAFGYSDASSGNYFYQITFFISIVSAFCCENKMPVWINSLLYYSLLIIIIIHFLQDIIIGEAYQGYTMSELREMGSSVIATSFSTLALVVFCVSLLVLLNVEKKYLKIIHVAIAALSFYYIVFCGQRGSVTILMILAAMFIIFERFFHKKSSKSSSSFIFMGLTICVAFLFGDSIISFLIQLSPNERLVARFEDLQGTVQQGVSDSSFSGRLSLEIVSIQSWLRDFFTFLFGIGDHRMEHLFGIQGYIMSGVGGHSEFIDSLARYGLVGTSIIAYLYYNICNYIYNLFDDVCIKNQVKAILIISVLIGFTKGLFFPEIGIGLFLILPLSSIILNKKQNTL